MKIFNKLSERGNSETLVARRASRMSTHDLHLWCDSLIMNLGRTYDSWNKDAAEPEDVDMLLDSINALWKELKSRG
jgi:hypothetical protein